MRVLILALMPLLAACATTGRDAENESGPLAAGSNRAFAHEQTTAATPEALWAAWMDVSRWKEWDQGLREAQASQPLALGVTGTIIDRSGNRAAIRVTEYVEGERYAFETSLPASKLRVRRIIVGREPTRFRHEVSFHGLAAPLWSAQLGGGFRRALPPTMARLAEVAEARRP